MWIWWAPFRSLLVSPTSSQWLTEPHAGQKPFLSAVSPPPIAQPLSSRAGFNGSVSPLSSLQTEGHSSHLAALCSILSISHVKTTYHPQSNGLVERFHRRLKEALQARAAGQDWLAHLPWVLLGIRSAVPLEGGPSPAEAVMGCQPMLPGEFLSTGEPPLEDFLDKLKADSLHPPRPILHKNTDLPTALPPDLAAAEFVFVRRDSVAPPLTPPYTGPFKVLRRSLHTFQVQVGNRTETISTHRLKTCVSSSDTAAAEPPRRGRPPLAQSGATTPKQKPGEITTSKIRAEQTVGSSLKNAQRE
jgi:hypothetical protein